MSVPATNTRRGAIDRGRLGTIATASHLIRSQARDWWQIATRTRFFFPLLLMFIAFALFLPRLAMPDKYLFDEILFAYTAGEYVEGNQDAYRWDHPCSTGKNPERCVELYPEAQQGDRIGRFQWDHPQVGKLFMTAGILVFGNDPFGWRFMSVVAGATGVVIAYYLGMMLTGRQAVGILAGCLLLMDGMYFVYSRMGLVDIHLTVLTMGSLLAFTWYLKTPPDRIRGPLLITGFLLGMSIATKWSAAYGAVFIGLVILWRFFSLLRASRQAGVESDVRAGMLQHMIWTPVALVVVPIAVYLVTYLPFFIDGGNSMSDFIALQKEMFQFHTQLSGNPPTSSRWWTWPLNLRSVWFGTRNFADGNIGVTYALGNPLLYWAILPAVVWTALRWWRSGQIVALTVLAVGFFGLWLPWMLVDRATYLYHFLPAVPIGCIAVAATIIHICDKWRDWRRTLAIEYVVLVALVFIFFYPIFSHYPISDHALELRLWLSSWR